MLPVGGPPGAGARLSVGREGEKSSQAEAALGAELLGEERRTVKPAHLRDSGRVPVVSYTIISHLCAFLFFSSPTEILSLEHKLLVYLVQLHGCP